MAILDFNADTVEPSSGFEVIPIGDYKAVVTASEMKDTKKGNGKYLQLTYDILEGKYKGRKLFDRLNLKNSNQKTVEIAQRDLSALCRAVGVMHPHDSGELHNKPFIISVIIQDPTAAYPNPSNAIKNRKSINGGNTLKNTPVPAPTPQQTEELANTTKEEDMPWE